jgi:DNA-binding NarL/FixJ family response regulator
VKGADLLRAVLDALDQPIFGLSPDLRRVLVRNDAAAQLVPAALPPSLTAAISEYLDRKDGVTPPVRTQLRERTFYLRVISAPSLAVVLLAEERLREADAFKLLHERNGISRREYQVLSGLRLGKTNRQIAGELGLAEGTVNVHVHHLLSRFDVPNRTRLVRVVDEIFNRRI